MELVGPVTAVGALDTLSGLLTGTRAGEALVAPMNCGAATAARQREVTTGAILVLVHAQ